MNTATSPSVAVVISTYNRSQSIAAAVASVLENTSPPFELYVIDQGPDLGVEAELKPFQADPRFFYHRSHSRGVSSGRNIGVTLAQTELILFTDDDCIVPPNWVERGVNEFLDDSNLGMLFGHVEAGPHDSELGFIPTYACTAPILAKTVRDKNGMRGIAASAGVRTSAFYEVGGFDEMLGPGAPFLSNEEGDLATRLLLKGYHVRATPAFAVIHNGFRTYQEGKSLAWRNWFGIGASYAKYIKAGRWSAASIYFWELFQGALRQLLQNSFDRRRPGGLTPLRAFLAGTHSCLITAIDRDTLQFVKHKHSNGGGLPTKGEVQNF